MSASPDKSAPPAWILRRHGPPVEIWGLSPEERLRRSLTRAGCTPVTVVDSESPPTPPAQGHIVVFRGDSIFDERLATALAAARDTLLVAPDQGAVAAHVGVEAIEGTLRALGPDAEAEPPVGLRRVTPGELAPAYVASLRKSEPPYVYPARPELAREVEARTFAASYKGITDLVTRWVWPRPAAAVTRACARAGIRPNTVTLWSWVFAIAAMLLFAEGWFGAGLVLAWAMTFLDTVDGKLARVTLTSSRLGDVLDHGLDLLHPPFWYFAWGVGLSEGHGVATALVVGGYVLGRLLEGVFLAAFKIETHSWKPIDSLFRTITARRNPNLILLSVGALAGRPDLGLWMVALWTVVSIGFHVARLLQAFGARSRGEAIVAWDAPRTRAATEGIA
jgi:phosphatidylglycerophosphate synthase